MSKKKHKLKHKGSWEEKQIDQPNKGKFVITPEMQQEAADRFKDPIKKWIASDEIIKNDQAVKINPFDSNIIPGMPNYMVNPPKMYDVDPFPPLASPEQIEILNEAYLKMQQEAAGTSSVEDTSWIQTFSGRKFFPLNPFLDSIVIQDIAHALSMQCRFTGHTKFFYSISQHSVLVSYLCDPIDSLWGLLHDSSEAYLTDLASPLKRSGKFQDYVECEKKLQVHICQRFGLSEIEPESVKRADKLLLSMEARDLMGPLHSDWKMNIKPLPFTITPLPPLEAEKLFLDRFDELFGAVK